MNNMFKQKSKKQIITIIALLIVVIVAIVVSVSLKGNKPDADVDADATTVTVSTDENVTTTQAVETTEPVEETEPVMLKEMAEYYEQNPDIAGWIWIDDTKLNYPVMYTPDLPEKYLRKNFEGKYSVGGVPFIDSDCSLDPESDNLIVYGHRMSNGTQFMTVLKYAEKAFWEEHPLIYYSTLYENRTYEILSCFYDRVYYKYEDVFKFYQFIDAEDEDDFNNAVANYKKKSLYDTGVTAEYGDKLITLVTCSHHTGNGRFVVVGRLIPEATY